MTLPDWSLSTMLKYGERRDGTPVMRLSASPASNIDTAPRMSSGLRKGEVASRSTNVSKDSPNISSAAFAQWRMAGIFGAASEASAAGRSIRTLAPPGACR